MRLRFPFVFGPAVVAEAPAAAVAPFWTNVTKASLAWTASRAGQIPRFEHIYAQEAGAEQQFRKVPPPD